MLPARVAEPRRRGAGGPDCRIQRGAQSRPGANHSHVFGTGQFGTVAGCGRHALATCGLRTATVSSHVCAATTVRLSPVSCRCTTETPLENQSASCIAGTSWQDGSQLVQEVARRREELAGETAADGTMHRTKDVLSVQLAPTHSGQQVFREPTLCNTAHHASPWCRRAYGVCHIG